MKTYFLSIETAAVMFPLVAFILTLPYAIYCYQKYGSISPLRTFILFSMVFYLQCAYFLVILPLPDPAEVAQKTGPYWSLVPFDFVHDFLAKSGFNVHKMSTWLPALKTSTALQPAFNFLLTVPWGVYLAYYFKSSLPKVLLFSFLLSLFFELTQLSGLYGLYPRPYRLFDVDDLMLNTLGGVAGYLLATTVLRVLPSRDKIDEKSRKRSTSVGYFRRILAFFIDFLIINFLDALLVNFLHLNDLLAFALALCAYSIAMPAIFKGATIGKALVRIRVRPVQNNKPQPQLFLQLGARYLLRNAAILAFVLATELTTAFDYSYQIEAVLLELAIVVLVIADMLWGLRHNRCLLYERLSKTGNISTITAQQHLKAP